jgi:hypothetical protein
MGGFGDVPVQEEWGATHWRQEEEWPYKQRIDTLGSLVQV